MKTKFELGEEVFLKAKILRVGLVGEGSDKVAYDLVVNTSRGEKLTTNYISEEDIEGLVQS